MFSKIALIYQGAMTCPLLRAVRMLKIPCVVIYQDRPLAPGVLDGLTAPFIQHLVVPRRAPGEHAAIEDVVEAAIRSGAQAIFPGNHWLARSGDFALACEEAGITFIGPDVAHLREFSDNRQARALAAAAGIPLVAGEVVSGDPAQVMQAARGLGFPVLIRAGESANYRCQNREQLALAGQQLQVVAGDNRPYGEHVPLYITRLLPDVTRIEVLILGDGRGDIRIAGELETVVAQDDRPVAMVSPAQVLSPALRQQLHDAALALGRSVNYRSIGSVIFLCDATAQQFWFVALLPCLPVFCEVSSRAYGLSLPEAMIHMANGQGQDVLAAIPQAPGTIAMGASLRAGHSVQGFIPQPGRLTAVTFADRVRADSAVQAGQLLATDADPLLAILVASGMTLHQVQETLAGALDASHIQGIATNQRYLTAALRHIPSDEALVEVLSAGQLTSVQDYPGRIAGLGIGLPPAGPLDDYAFQLANRIVGNHPGVAALEITLTGPVLRFHCDTIIALTGAVCAATLDGEPVSYWQPIRVAPGQTLTLGQASRGCRAYLAIRNGIDVPRYLGSRATCFAGEVGGHGGRALRSGDLLALMSPVDADSRGLAPIALPRQPEPALIPDYSQTWHIGVLYGPHGAPDCVSAEMVCALLDTVWRVTQPPERRGVQLTGSGSEWTGACGVDGVSPGSIPEGSVPAGAVQFAGGEIRILTCDSPVLGGYICPLTIASAELWKIGQLCPNDQISFHLIDFEHAQSLALARQVAVTNLYAAGVLPDKHPQAAPGSAILARLPERDDGPKMVVRQAGDTHLLIEYGQPEYQIALRLRVEALMSALLSNAQEGVQALVPGVRSLLVRYDNQRISQRELVRVLIGVDQQLADISGMVVPSRTLVLPMVFDSQVTRQAIKRYQATAPAPAPWLPDNVHYLQQINGVGSRQKLEHIFFQAAFLVLACGGVAPGAPCAVALDPRHRLRATPYNPPRAWTPQGSVGIGSGHLTLYSQHAPGTEQLAGRTLAVWDAWRQSPLFGDDPWHLRTFDQIRFYPVSDIQMDTLLAAEDGGWSAVRISGGVFDLKAYQQFLASQAMEIGLFLARQTADFRREVARQPAFVARAPFCGPRISGQPEVPAPGERGLVSHYSGVLRRWLVAVGDTVRQGTPLFVIEVMQTLSVVCSPDSGTVVRQRYTEGSQVTAGENALVLNIQGAIPPA